MIALPNIVWGGLLLWGRMRLPAFEPADVDSLFATHLGGGILALAGGVWTIGVGRRFRRSADAGPNDHDLHDAALQGLGGLLGFLVVPLLAAALFAFLLLIPAIGLVAALLRAT